MTENTNAKQFEEKMVERMKQWPELLKKIPMSGYALAKEIGVHVSVVYKWLDYEKYGIRPTSENFDKVEAVIAGNS